MRWRAVLVVSVLVVTMVPLAGDWGVLDGSDTPAAYRSSNTIVYFRSTNTAGTAEFEFVSGRTGDVPVSGAWSD